jgi:Pectinacetylesterase
MRKAVLFCVAVGLFSIGCGAPVAPETEPDPIAATEDETYIDDTAAEQADLTFGNGQASGPALRGTVDTVSSQVFATDKAWSFVDVPESRCANGTPTGFGLNPNAASDELVVYFQSGGACWNLATCGIGTSANIRTGYQGADFDKDGARDWSIFSRTEPRNPFRNMNLVYVPYCTADVHAGNKITDYGLVQINHHGARNVEALLLRLKATYPNLRRLIVAGTSAGGFGAQLNFPRFAAAFPNAKLDVVVDSAQMLTPQGSLAQEFAGNWGVTVPSDCTGCLQNYPSYVSYLLQKNPRSNFALFASMRDAVLTPFLGFGINVQAFRDETATLLVTRYDPQSNGRYIARRWFRHGYLEGVKQITSNENKVSFEFLTAFLAGTAVNKRPF